MKLKDFANIAPAFEKALGHHFEADSGNESAAAEQTNAA